MCHQCEIKPVYEFTNQRKLCKTCFIRWFEKKVFYTIRKFKLIKREDIILVKNKTNFRDIILKKVLEMFCEKAGNKLIYSGKKYNKIAILNTLDIESNKIINEIIKGKMQLKEASPMQGKIIKPLYLFLDKEIILYAKIKKIKIKKPKTKIDKISKFIEEMEIKHPEVKRAIVNSYLELYN